MGSATGHPARRISNLAAGVAASDAVNVSQLNAMGSRLSERIGKLRHPMCTFENPLWYSHRRSSRANKAHEGRMLALIMRN